MAAVSKARKYKHASHVTWRQVEKDAVILDLNTSVYFSLNEVGVLVWERLGKGASVEEIRDEVCRVYDVPAKTAQKDIEDLISQLKKKDLLVEA